MSSNVIKPSVHQHFWLPIVVFFSVVFPQDDHNVDIIQVSSRSEFLFGNREGKGNVANKYAYFQIKCKRHLGFVYIGTKAKPTSLQMDLPRIQFNVHIEQWQNFFSLFLSVNAHLRRMSALAIAISPAAHYIPLVAFSDMALESEQSINAM